MAASDTIFALSSGRLPAGVAVVRLSGSRVRFVFETFFGKVPAANEMTYGSVRTQEGELIDRGLIVYFEGPHSFTGEDCGEFHLHGGIAVVQALFDSLSKLNSVRPAEAGEFSRRAFMNGKMDLTQAEGLADLIAAETDGQRRLALRQSEGQVQQIYEGWRAILVQARALAEASIDFSDEDDVSAIAMVNAAEIVSGLAAEMRLYLSGYRRSEIVRDGFKVVILGAPNSGKSTLINALAGREVAIATDEAGTTRDLIDVRLDLNGNLVIVTDTAGIRENAGMVESIGISKAINRARHADLILVLEDVLAPIPVDVDLGECAILRIGNKADLLLEVRNGYDLLVSAATGAGVSDLLGKISDLASSQVNGTDFFAVQERHIRLLESCLIEMSSFLDSCDAADLAAEHLRVASDELGSLTGRIGVEELLGEIFSRFCIGK